MKKFCKKCWQNFVWLDKFLDKHFCFVFVLMLVVLIRFPYFFEPHYYLDEGIYLTIGQGIRRGLDLYRDLFDHKTPLIYWLAAGASTFFNWRIIHFILSLLMAAVFYRLSEKLLKSKIAVVASTIIFVLATNLPTFEGNILNGELLSMIFVLGGMAWLAPTKKSWWEKFLSKKQIFNRGDGRGFLIIGGALFGLAFLTKFHAAFDILAALILLVLPWQKKISWQKFWSFASGFIVVNLIALFYFFCRGEIFYYLYDAFIYNFAYSAYSEHANLLIAVVGAVIYLIFLWWQIRRHHHKLNLPLLFVLAWLVATLMAANLSGRAYAHYFLQVFPALSLLAGLLVDGLLSEKFNHQWLGKISRKIQVTIPIGVVMVLSVLVAVITNKMEIQRVTASQYYQNFWRYFTRKQNRAQYINFFGAVTSDNYQIAPFLIAAQEKQLLIFGNNPTLYSITDLQPVNLPFTTNFHYYDFVNYQVDLYRDLTSKQQSAENLATVNYVVMMKQIDNYEQEKIDQENLLKWLQAENFQTIYNGETLVLWQRN